MSKIQCPYCGAKNDDDDAFCMNCGKPIRDLNLEAEFDDDLEYEPEDIDPIDSNRCPYCGFEVNNDDVFCENCGKKLSPYESNIKKKSLSEPVSLPKSTYDSDALKTGSGSTLIIRTGSSKSKSDSSENQNSSFKKIRGFDN